MSIHQHNLMSGKHCGLCGSCRFDVPRFLLINNKRFEFTISNHGSETTAKFY